MRQHVLFYVYCKKEELKIDCSETQINTGVGGLFWICHGFTDDPTGDQCEYSYQLILEIN